MFFVLSKLLFFFIRPLNWVAALLIYGLMAKPGLRKRRALRLALGLLLVFTNPILPNLLLRWWEVRPVEIAQLEQNYPYGIVLGGYLSFRTASPRDRANLNENPNRLINAAELHRLGKIGKILLSGGGGSLLHGDLFDDQEAPRLLLRLGVLEDDIVVEGQSRNTYENIRNSKALLPADSTVLLFTSAFHMRRALAICRKQGVDAIPYPTDVKYQPPTWAPNDWLLPDPGALRKWEILCKEWIGLITYKLLGYA